MEAASSDDEVKMIFAMDEAAELILATGYKKGLATLGLDDRADVRGALLDYHCILKVKAEMDQFADGLNSVGVLQLYSSVMEPLLTDCCLGVVTAGNVIK